MHHDAKRGSEAGEPQQVHCACKSGHMFFCQCLYQVGALPPAGNGVPAAQPATLSIAELEQARYEQNCSLVQRLREDDQAASLLESSMCDAAENRMTAPRPLDMEQMVQQNLAPRFAVVQGAAAVLQRPAHGPNDI